MPCNPLAQSSPPIVQGWWFISFICEWKKKASWLACRNFGKPSAKPTGVLVSERSFVAPRIRDTLYFIVCLFAATLKLKTIVHVAGLISILHVCCDDVHKTEQCICTWRYTSIHEELWLFHIFHYANTELPKRIHAHVHIQRSSIRQI